MERQKATLVIRNARPEDATAIADLSGRVYPGMSPYHPDMIAAVIRAFPEGQFVAEHEGRVAGYCSTFRLREDIALKPHTWREITGGGYGSRHDPAGDWLYGMEVFVDPGLRGLRIGQRFYNARKALCHRLGLKGIVFGGRIPSYARRKAAYESAKAYVEAVQHRKARDPVLSFQLRNGFEVIGVLEGYLPTDRESEGFATHMVWRNPIVKEQAKPGAATAGPRPEPRTIRVASIQYGQRRVGSFEEFARHVEYFVDVVADYQSDFAVFPELFTLQLLSLEQEKLRPAEAIGRLTGYTERILEMFSRLAVSYNVNIVGGSHPTRAPDGNIQNVSYVFLRDGSVHSQVKVHPTPNEKFWWDIRGGDQLSVINTDCGPIGVLICYDAEFPELARHLVDQGAHILFVPFCTDVRQAYLRVRYCAQARAVENQCFVVMSGNVGNLPNVANMDIQYAQSCILTPCDFLFSRDGVAADTTPNVEMVAVADLRPENLHLSRNSGSVTNLRDRRFDLYNLRWR